MLRKYALPLLILAALIVGILIATFVFAPTTHPAYAAALAFAEAAGRGDESAVQAQTGEALRAWASANCPDGRLTACVASYIPPAWGDFVSVVFRRAVPDAATAFDVDLIATYSQGAGFSGVCIYTRVEQGDDGVWRVVGYAGFVHCGDPRSRQMAGSPDAPHRAP